MKADFLSTVDEMIREQGEYWLLNDEFPNRSEQHNAVVVTDHPEHCWRLVYVDGQWQSHEDRLNFSELAEFFAAFGSHWNILLNARLDVSNDWMPIRAFIKNGRKRGGFSISVRVTTGQKRAEAA